jgi:hypothetical protein
MHSDTVSCAGIAAPASSRELTNGPPDSAAQPLDAPPHDVGSTAQNGPVVAQNASQPTNGALYKTWQDPLAKTPVFQQLEELFESRIAYIDGAMGTMIQRYKLQVRGCLWPASPGFCGIIGAFVAWVCSAMGTSKHHTSGS